MGKGVEKDVVKAVKWYAKASAAGFVPATRALESMRKGSQASAESNLATGRQLYELAERLYRGNGVDQDKGKAIEALRVAAEPPLNFPRAQNDLGFALMHGGEVRRGAGGGAFTHPSAFTPQPCWS